MSTGPPNLLLLDDFCGELDPDCVHFTILAGVNFVHFVVDQAAVSLLLNFVMRLGAA